MTWRDLLENRRSTAIRLSSEELADLRNAVKRDLRDAAVSELSADNRFGLAYEAGCCWQKWCLHVRATG